ncbi:MAG: protein phosphatase 2C domain-containing protein [Chitinophagales bacterium]
MKIHTFSQIGQFHTDHNEDHLITTSIGDKTQLIAVMDGCTMGIESHFASTLIGKLLRKIAKEVGYRIFAEKTQYELSFLLKETMRQLFSHLQKLQYQLDLKREELLSTLILGVVDTSKKQAEILVVGDGLVCCNGELFEYEQDNHPDYLGYHLQENFEEWYALQKQRLSFSEVQDLSIATDGIFSFQPFDVGVYEAVTAAEIVDWLLKGKEFEEHKVMLKKKVKYIEKTWGLKPSDDLSMIRVVF